MGIKLKQIESEILCRGSGGVKMTSVTTPDHVVDHNWPKLCLHFLSFKKRTYLKGKPDESIHHSKSYLFLRSDHLTENLL